MAGAAQRDSGRLLTGWGRTTLSRAKVVGPLPGDVHGKNQLSDGSLAQWITEIEILDGTGEVRR